MRKRRPLSHGKVDEEENGGEQRRMDTKEVAGRHEEPLRTQAFRHRGKDGVNAVGRTTGEYEGRRGGEEKSKRRPAATDDLSDARCFAVEMVPGGTRLAPQTSLGLQVGG